MGLKAVNTIKKPHNTENTIIKPLTKKKIIRTKQKQKEPEAN